MHSLLDESGQLQNMSLYLLGKCPRCSLDGDWEGFRSVLEVLEKRKIRRLWQETNCCLSTIPYFVTDQGMSWICSNVTQPSRN